MAEWKIRIGKNPNSNNLAISIDSYPDHSKAIRFYTTKLMSAPELKFDSQACIRFPKNEPILAKLKLPANKVKATATKLDFMDLVAKAHGIEEDDVILVDTIHTSELY